MDPSSAAASSARRAVILVPDLPTGDGGERVLFRAWQPLMERLSASFEVAPWPWARDEGLVALAARLGARLVAAAVAGSSPHVVAHGVGARLLMDWIRSEPGRWADLAAAGSRAVLLGPVVPPCWGFAPYLLGEGVRPVPLVGDPLVAALCPAPEGPIRDLLLRLFGSGPIQALRSHVPAPMAPPPSVSAVVGFAHDTDAEPVLVPGDRTGSRPRLAYHPAPGDGLVTVDAAHLPGVGTWYTPASHGAMVEDPAVGGAVVDLLLRGLTRRLFDGWTGGPRPPAAPRLHDEKAGSPDPEPDAPLARLDPPPGLRCLRVSVLCGDPDSLPAPVVLGGWQGARSPRLLPPWRVPGAVKNLPCFVDAEAGGGLLDDRPVVPLPQQDPVVLLVNLGFRESLTRTTVREGMRRAVQSWEGGRADRRRVLYATLPGVLEGDLPVPEVVSALVEGVILGNRGCAPGAPTVDELVVLEPFEDVAVAAARAVVDLGRLLRLPLVSGEHLCPSPHLVEGPHTRSVSDLGVQTTRPWQRVGLRSASQGTAVEFSWATHRAVEERHTVNEAGRTLEDGLTRIQEYSRYDGMLARALFHAAIPVALKARWTAQDDLLLVVDEHTSRYPWEYMAFDDGNERVCPALERGMVRQFATEDLEPSPEPDTDRVLVIGDPDPENPLPDAAREARHVAALYRQAGYPVIERVGGSRGDIQAAFFSEARVLHVAAHGVLSDSDPSRCGIRLQGDRFLTPEWFRQRTHLPSVIFLSCCFLGLVQPSVRGRGSRLAPSLLQQFFRQGARAVVAAAWKVEDQAGRAFAVAFHEAMLQGRTFGRALQIARRVAGEFRNDEPTWAAWHGYGDPDFRLEPARSRTSHRSLAPRFVAVAEVVDDLRRLDAEAHRGLAVSRGRVRDDLGERERWIRQEPAFQQGRVWEALADAWASAGDPQRAIDAWERALRTATDRGTASLRALEQCLNLRERQISEEFRAADAAGRERCLAAQRSMPERFGHLLELTGPSVERLSLLGAAWKRLAAMLLAMPPFPARSQEALQAVEAAELAYGAAVEVARTEGQPEVYPGLNLLMLRWVRGAEAEGDGARLDRYVEEAAGLVEARYEDPWTRVQRADTLALRWLRTGGDDPTGEVVQPYVEVFDRGASARIRGSVVGQFRALQQLMHALAPDHPARGRLERLLACLED